LYGWTQRDLAERLEVDPVTVSRWERGVSAPRRAIARRLERLFEAASAAVAPRSRTDATAASTARRAGSVSRSAPATPSKPSSGSPPRPSPPTPPTRFEGIDELVRIVGLDRALDALRELALIGRAPAPVRFAADPTTRLREVEAALREQSELIARARIRRG